MSDNDASREAILQSSFRDLSTATRDLNNASDDFGNSIRILNDAFDALNIGVTGWVTVSTSLDQKNPSISIEEQVGYGKLGPRKGLAVRIVKIDRGSGEEVEQVKDEWLLNDAPRAMRLRAVNLIPKLMQTLTREAAHTAKMVREKADLAKQLIVAVNAIAKGGQR